MAKRGGSHGPRLDTWTFEVLWRDWVGRSLLVILSDHFERFFPEGCGPESVFVVEKCHFGKLRTRA
jgi:hypothetical protein